MKERIKQRVDKGIALLDDKVPDWRKKIDKNSLVVSSINHCVLSQVFADKYDGFRAFIYGTRDLGLNSIGSIVQHGFGFAATLEYIPQLQNEWLSRL